MGSFSSFVRVIDNDDGKLMLHEFNSDCTFCSLSPGFVTLSMASARVRLNGVFSGDAGFVASFIFLLDSTVFVVFELGLLTLLFTVAFTSTLPAASVMGLGDFGAFALAVLVVQIGLFGFLVSSVLEMLVAGLGALFNGCLDTLDALGGMGGLVAYTGVLAE